jgi:hypothetical protein
MKTKLISNGGPAAAGYALLLAMSVIAASIIVLAGTMGYTAAVARLNDRNNQYTVNLNAAEAAVEKVFVRMAYDYQAYGLGLVTNNLALYRMSVPTAAEDPFWGGFQFSDAQGNVDRTYVGFLTNYTGLLPSQYRGAFVTKSPVYRIVSNVKATDGRYDMTNAVQVDVLLALVPLTTYAIFYNSLLEFSTCQTMTVNGRTHANGSIYTGTSASLTFNGTVTTTGTISSPKNNGQGPSWNDTGTFNGNPSYKTNVPSVMISITMTNTHSLIEIPPPSQPVGATLGAEPLYNLAQVILLVSNNVVTAKLQASINGDVPGADPAPIVLTSTNTPAALSTNFPFLTVTNTFTDQRENKTIFPTQIDVAKYGAWLTTNSSVLTKFPSGSGTYPTILFAADNRTNSSSQLSAVRLVNGIAPPQNGGLGFSVATPNPLYVLGHYNCTNAAYLGTTNTSASVPCAFMSDALTILSSSWQDSKSSGDYSSRQAANNTVNAAIITGIVPSTGTSSTTFSGGVHNLPRLLEDWGGKTLTLNTSIVNLFQSTRATGKFVNPGTYYAPPNRQFSFDLNFLDPQKQPPGVPCALIPIRFAWAAPPPSTVTYNVTP